MNPSTASEATVMKTMQSLGAVIGPTALVTALLFYFGWARTQSQAQYLGLDVTLFGFSSQDYILQSTYSVLVPLGELLLGGLGLLWLHRAVSQLVGRCGDRPFWPWLEGSAAVAGGSLFGIGLLKNNDRYPTDAGLLLTPLFLTLGVGLVSYALFIHRQRSAARAGPESTVTPAARGGPPLSTILVAMLIAVGLVWEVANYAEIKGRELGAFLADQLEFQPGVVVYSPKRLHIDTGGVVETGFPEPESAYGFRYTGLKLLFRANDRFFLVPESWTVDGGTTIVLRDSDELRMEFIRSGR